MPSVDLLECPFEEEDLSQSDKPVSSPPTASRWKHPRPQARPWPRAIKYFVGLGKPLRRSELNQQEFDGSGNSVHRNQQGTPSKREPDQQDMDWVETKPLKRKGTLLI
jgi:hypothetical protein